MYYKTNVKELYIFSFINISSDESYLLDVLLYLYNSLDIASCVEEGWGTQFWPALIEWLELW